MLYFLPIIMQYVFRKVVLKKKWASIKIHFCIWFFGLSKVLPSQIVWKKCGETSEALEFKNPRIFK